MLRCLLTPIDFIMLSSMNGWVEFDPQVQNHACRRRKVKWILHHDIKLWVFVCFKVPIVEISIYSDKRVNLKGLLLAILNIIRVIFITTAVIKLTAVLFRIFKIIIAFDPLIFGMGIRQMQWQHRPRGYIWQTILSRHYQC